MRKIDHDRELYECECGKTYWSYSALYVHAMVKHNVKLSFSKKSGKVVKFK